MLTVLFVKALQAPQSTCIETLHTCWCMFWWCCWHSPCQTQEEVGRAARPALKFAPQGVVQGTWMSTKSKEMMPVCTPKTKMIPASTSNKSGGNKKKNLGLCNYREDNDNALHATRPKPRQMRTGLCEDFSFLRRNLTAMGKRV